MQVIWPLWFWELLKFPLALGSVLGCGDHNFSRPYEIRYDVVGVVTGSCGRASLLYCTKCRYRKGTMLRPKFRKRLLRPSQSSTLLFEEGHFAKPAFENFSILSPWHYCLLLLSSSFRNFATIHPALPHRYSMTVLPGVPSSLACFPENISEHSFRPLVESPIPLRYSRDSLLSHLS